jgi:hypothetical protein
MKVFNLSLVDMLVQGLQPLVIGLVLPYLMNALKKLGKPTGTGAREVQQFMVVVLSALLTGVATAIGVELGADPSAWTHAEVNLLLSSGIAFATHAGRKAKAAEVLAVENAAVLAGAHRAAIGALAREMESSGINPMQIDPPTPRYPSGGRGV